MIKNKGWEREFELWWKSQSVPRDNINDFKQFIRQLLAQELRGLLMEERHHIEHGWKCPECSTYGEEGEYCPKDRRKLKEEKQRWESLEDEAYNQACSEINAKIRKLLDKTKTA